MKSEKLILNHAHVYPDFLLTSPTTPSHYKELPLVTLQHLADVTAQLGIERTVVFPPLSTSKRHPDFDPSEWLAEAIADYPQFIGYGTVRYWMDDLADQCNRIADSGLRGIKIHTSVQQVEVNSERAFVIYEVAQRHGLIVDFHTGGHGYRLKHDSDPIAYDEVTWHFPELKIVLEHFGHWPFHQQMAGVIQNANSRSAQVRVYAGLTPSNMLPHGKGGKYPGLTQEELERVIDFIGEDAMILGLDFPHFTAEQFELVIQEVRKLNISEEGKQNILGGNISRLLGINL